MKNFKILILFALGVFVSACSVDDPLAVVTQETVARGAVLRTTNTESAVFKATELDSFWAISIEEQDLEDGDLLSSVEVYLTFVDNTDDGIENGVSETLYQSIPASAFASGVNGLPITDISITLQEAVTFFGLGPTDFTGGDSVTIRLDLMLTDGRSFTNTDATGNVSGGSFFSSPYRYQALLVCPLDNTLFDGTYTVIDDAWADYTPGQTVPVIPGDEPDEVFILGTNNPFIVNSATAYFILTIDGETGAAVVTANEPFDYGAPGAPFLIEIGGAGSVNTCNGNIDINIDFIGFGSPWHFEIEKN